jgi:hypothetical protein
MTMPKSIATWCMILFFLFFALSALIGGGGRVFAVLEGIFALGAAVFLFMGR